MEVLQTPSFSRGLDDLRDERTVSRIQARVDRLQTRNFGNTQAVGEGVAELQIHCGPGYSVYFARRGTRVVLLPCGGDKSTQSSDIAKTKIASEGMENDT